MQLQHQKITLDVNDTRAYTVLNAHQGDSKTRFIDIALTDGGNAITLSSNYVATVKASINNKIKAVNTAVVDTTNNVITVELTKTMLDTPGLLNCEVILQEGQQIVTSATFTVKVAESVISDESEIVESQEFGKLNDALAEIKEIEDKADKVQSLVDNISQLSNVDRLITLAEHDCFSYSATFTSDGVIKVINTSSTLQVGSFATNQQDIVTAYVSNAVTKIGSGTFSNCTSLKTIYIDNTVGNIDIASGAVPNGVSIVYSDDENFINVNELLASAIKSLKQQVSADKSELSQAIQVVKESALEEFANVKADFNSYKTSNDNAVNSKVDTTEFSTYKSETDTAINANASSIAKKYDCSKIETGIGNVYDQNSNVVATFNYCKIEKMVTIQIAISNLPSDKNYLYCTGLPFKAVVGQTYRWLVISSANNQYKIAVSDNHFHINKIGLNFTSDETITTTFSYLI